MKANVKTIVENACIMKYSMFLIVLALWLLPTAGHAQTNDVAVPMQTRHNALLDAKSQGYHPVQATEAIGFSAGDQVAGTAIATQHYQVYTTGASYSATASYAASSMSARIDVPIQSVGVALPMAWKGSVSDVGAVSPMTVADGLTKRRAGSWGNNNKPADPFVPVGDTPWLVLVLCVVGYMLLRKPLYKQG